MACAGEVSMDLGKMDAEPPTRSKRKFMLGVGVFAFATIVLLVSVFVGTIVSLDMTKDTEVSRNGVMMTHGANQRPVATAAVISSHNLSALFDFNDRQLAEVETITLVVRPKGKGAAKSNIQQKVFLKVSAIMRAGNEKAERVSVYFFNNPFAKAIHLSSAGIDVEPFGQDTDGRRLTWIKLEYCYYDGLGWSVDFAIIPGPNETEESIANETETGPHFVWDWFQLDFLLQMGCIELGTAELKEGGGMDFHPAEH